ncbi:MAG: hypothetical protein HC889_08620 [Synechococcaceae cyanobacterium SM1_2_3]|nr:hypothetical protein [Synechococcaceae cyanobacterium SM1_2_3]
MEPESQPITGIFTEGFKMTMNIQFSSKMIWSLAQIAAVITLVYSYFKWMTMSGASLIHKASQNIQNVLPTDCPAFHAYRGHFDNPLDRYYCVWEGTPDSNPWFFAAMLLIFVVSILFLIYTGLTGKGFEVQNRFRS